MNFMFSWQEQYLTRSLRSLVRYCCCHSNIKFISSRHRVISSIYMGEVKLVASFLRKRWFPLVFSRCGFQGKLKLLLGFGFIVSFNIVLFCTYTLKFCQCVSIGSSNFLSSF